MHMITQLCKFMWIDPYCPCIRYAFTAIFTKIILAIIDAFIYIHTHLLLAVIQANIK